MMHYYDNGYGYGIGYGFGPFDFLFHVVGVLVFVALVIFVLRMVLGRPRHWPKHVRGQSPLDILAERYAKGEIDKEEYKERKKVLSE